MSVHRRTPWLLAALFALVTGMPLMLLLALPTAEVGETEKRKLATFPDTPTDMAGIRTYPEQFERWFNDHFGLRAALVRGNSRARLGLLAVSTSPGVVPGNDGWLYYSGRIMDDFRGLHRFSHDRLIYWQRFLEGRRDWLARQGVHYLFVVAPNKQSIYPEFVPAHQNRVGAPWLDQLIAHLKQNSDLDILDLRPALARAKHTGPLYDKTDSHWNDLGAYVAYTEIMKRLAVWFPELSATPLERFRMETRTESGGNLADLLNLRDDLPEDRLYLTPKTPPCAERTEIQLATKPSWASHIRPFQTRCDTAPDVRAVILRDSFFIRLAPFMSESLRQVDYVRQAHAGSRLKDSFPLMRELVLRERPHVVIDEIVERMLNTSLALHQPMLVASARKYFQASGTVLLAGGFSGEPVPARPVRQAAVTLENGKTGILTTGPEGLVEFPPIRVPDGRWPVVHLRLDSPEPTIAKLLYRTAGVPRYTPDQLVSVLLEKGENDLYLELPAAAITGSLRLHPGSAPGHYAVGGLEVRTRPIPVPVTGPSTAPARAAG